MNKKIIEALFPQSIQNIENGNCPLCGNKIIMSEFKDELSLKEFKISKMCQCCQDEIFG